MGNELSVPNLTAIQVREQVNLIQEVMRNVMQEGQHYGKIKGCGEKPTLLKPGAEKLSMTFRLRPIIDNERDVNIEMLPNGHKDIRVYCHVFNMEGVELSTGVGSCSTMESKYRYRGGEKEGTGQAVPTEYWNLRKAGKNDEAQALIGGQGFGVGKIDGIWQICVLGEKIENPDIADQYNTVLKMAKKRAYVDGILSATAASDIFTQDIEDFPDGSLGKKVEEKPAGDMPKTTDEKPKTETGSELKVISVSCAVNDKKKHGEVFDMIGIYQSFKVRETATKKKVYDCEIIDTQQDVSIIVSVWGEPKLVAGDNVYAKQMSVYNPKGDKVNYSAKELAKVIGE